MPGCARVGDRHGPGPTIFAQKPWAGVASGVVAAATQEHSDASREANHRRLDPGSVSWAQAHDIQRRSGLRWLALPARMRS